MSCTEIIRIILTCRWICLWASSEFQVRNACMLQNLSAYFCLHYISFLAGVHLPLTSSIPLGINRFQYIPINRESHSVQYYDDNGCRNGLLFTFLYASHWKFILFCWSMLLRQTNILVFPGNAFDNFIYAFISVCLGYLYF